MHQSFLIDPISPREFSEMLMRSFLSKIAALMTVALLPSFAWADPPGTMFIYPAGGQRGTTVNVRIGGLCLHGDCPLEMLGPGVKASERIKQSDTIWFEGPVI